MKDEGKLTEGGESRALDAWVADKVKPHTLIGETF